MNRKQGGYPRFHRDPRLYHPSPRHIKGDFSNFSGGNFGVGRAVDFVVDRWSIWYPWSTKDVDHPTLDFIGFFGFVVEVVLGGRPHIDQTTDRPPIDHQRCKSLKTTGSVVDPWSMVGRKHHCKRVFPCRYPTTL